MKTRDFNVALTALALASATLAVRAQTQQRQSPGDPAPTQVVVITGVAGSVENSLNQKRRATNFVEAITAEDIGKFPDLNLSESLQRVPGITLERNNVGDGSAINLRGLGPQFTVVTINGMEGVSPGSDNNFGRPNGSRGFNFEILPSELFTNATVNKTVDAAQVEGGLAGVVELQTPRPLYQKGLKYVVSLKGNHSDKAGQWDPRGTLFLSNNWDRTFGLSLSLAAADTRYRADTAQGGSYRAFGAVNTGTRASDAIRALDVANGPRYLYYDDTRKTSGAATTAQWRPAKGLELTADLLVGRLSSRRNITRDDAATESGVNVPISTVVDNGLITAGQFTGVQQRVGTNFFSTEEDLRQLSLAAIWRIDGGWTVRPFVGNARRSAERTEDLYSFRLAKDGKFDPGVVSYAVRGDYLDFSTTGTDFSSNPNDFLFNVFVFRPSTDTDKARTAKLDVEKEFDSGVLTMIKFGLRASTHDKDSVASQWRLNRRSGVAIGVPPSLGSVAGLVDFHVDGAGSFVPSKLLIADPAMIHGVFMPGGAPLVSLARADLLAFGAQSSYAIKEDTRNAYASGSFDLFGASIDAGIRYVRTEQTSSGFTVDNANLPTQRITPVSYSSTYHMYLPSANLRYAYSPKLIARAAYSRTLTRPDLISLAPSELVNGIDQSGGRGSRGNPDLKPYTSNNVDLGLEWYADKAAMLGATVFRKEIKGYIDTTTFTETRSFPRQADGVIVSGPIIFTQPVNGVSATINGAELTAQSSFGFLPEGWWRKLGAIFNYTYTRSTANFSVAGDARSSGLPGLSKNSYNASVYYDDGTIDGRLSYAWRGRYLAQFSDDFGVPRFRDPYGQFDLSASYKINKNLTFQVDVLNLGKSQFADKSSAKFYPYGVYDLDRRILFGLRYAN